MKNQTLNGIWKYRVGKGKWTQKNVPFSALCVGHSECERYFDLEYTAQTVLLKFDGITYNAKAYLNGKLLGKMLPYSEYVFDISQIAKAKGNCLFVEIEDISAPFGPSEGWENYGGIVRDVSIIYKNDMYIKDVFFKAQLTDNYKNAMYEVEVLSNVFAKYRVTLSYNGKSIDCYESDRTEKRQINDVMLWSVDEPNLYSLDVELLKDGGVVDTYSIQVGFREFKCGKNRFFLNGKPIFLKGVCKHEMYGKDSGHTVSYEQILKDMEMIKETGCNFVRLVHYPHNKATLEIADRIGLLCCEEPGLWQADTKNPEVTRDCLAVLEKMVIRDRSHPSIVFWLAFNECDFDESFLNDAVDVCRKNDGTRPVSGANNMSNEETLKYYNLCGLDFYTMHPYSQTFDMAREASRVLCDKPLMFTEWGGYYVYDNPHLLSDFLSEMFELYKNERLAGTCLWYWAEINDYNRGGAACVDGVLKEALVDFERKPNLIYRAFCKSLKDMEKEETEAEKYEFSLLDYDLGTPLACTALPNHPRLLEIARQELKSRLAKTRKKVVRVGPVLQKEELLGISKIPYVVEKGKILEFTGGTAVGETLSVLGMTSLNYGYPILGKYGEDVLKITVWYKDNSSEEYIARNGVDVTVAYTSVGSSRVEPVAEKATRAAKFSYDKNFEEYIINRLDINVQEKEIAKVTFEALNESYNVLIYGIFS